MKPQGVRRSPQSVPNYSFHSSYWQPVPSFHVNDDRSRKRLARHAQGRHVANSCTHQSQFLYSGDKRNASVNGILEGVHSRPTDVGINGNHSVIHPVQMARRLQMLIEIQHTALIDGDRPYFISELTVAE